MNAAALIVLAVQVSIVLTVFALGLNAQPRDVVSLLRRPSWLARALLGMNVIMPVVAAIGVGVLQIHPAVEFAIVALSISPVPPLLPRKGLQSGADASYTFGLLVVAGLLAIVFVPLAVEVLRRVFSRTDHVPVLSIARLVFVTILLPLAAGMAVRHWAPGLASRLARPMSVIATVLLLAAALPLLIGTWPAMVALIGNGTVLALAVFVAVGLAVGQMLGGPGSEERTVLALCTACRHPGVALAVAHVNYPEHRSAAAAVALYLIVAGVLSTLYVMRRRRPAAVEHAARVG
jgi:BASS family bile acid:Na+ symporter